MQRFAKAMNDNDLVDVKVLIEELGIVCPVSGTKIGLMYVNLI